jgi:hypothetical protein
MMNQVLSINTSDAAGGIHVGMRMNANSIRKDSASTMGSPFGRGDGPFFQQISHRRVTATFDRGNRAMKTWMQNSEIAATLGNEGGVL